VPRRLAATTALLTTALLTAALVLTSCAVPGAPSESPSPSIPAFDGVDGGGAAEVAAPASALLVADEAGTITILDLATEEREQLDGDGAVFGTGRFGYRVQSDDTATSVQIVDSGRWTVPHGDHSHSFRGETRIAGSVEGAGDVRVTVGDHVTAALFDDELALIDHEDAGEADPVRIPVPSEAPEFVVPFAGHLLSATASAVDVLDDAGAATGTSVPCAHPTDADITRVGAVIACADGVALVTREVGGTLSAESIPYPAGAPTTSQLLGRADRPDLAGVAGDRGAWLLDSRARSWTLLPTDVPLVAASAIGDDDGRTVVVADDGTVRVLAADGAEIARTDPLVTASLDDPAARARITLLVGAAHAYVSDPAAGEIHEIDHLDGALVTRTFAGLDPWHVQLVG
jgi:hypothetical protein